MAKASACCADRAEGAAPRQPTHRTGQYPVHPYWANADAANVMKAAFNRRVPIADATDHHLAVQVSIKLTGADSIARSLSHRVFSNESASLTLPSPGSRRHGK